MSEMKQNTAGEMTLGSLFDGSGGFPLAGTIAGIRPVWASEVEPYPIRVTTRRLPQMKHYGDVSALNGAELEPVDIITFGSPCQDMSIAGKRVGLDGERSGLFHEAVRIIKEMREATNGEKPRYAVWENVPGAFSSNNGEDFRCVLEELCKVREAEVSVPFPGCRWSPAGEVLGDGYSLAWRVLDAQYWGVPQRRARIFLVADFGGGSAPDVLFNSEGVSGYSAEGFEAWKRAANDPEKGAGEAGGGAGVSGCVSADGYNGSVSEKASTLGVNCGMSTGRNAIILNDQGGERMDVTEDVTSTLRAEAHHPPVVLDETVGAAGFCTEHSADSRGIGYEEEKSPTLRAGVVPGAIALEHHPNDNRIGIEKGEAIQTLSGRMGTGGGNVPLIMEQEMEPVTLKIRSGCDGGGKGALQQVNKSATLGTHNDQTLFEPVNGERQAAFGISSYKSHAMLSDNPHAGIYEARTSRTLDCSGGTPAQHQGGIAIVAYTENQRDEVRDLHDKSGCLAGAGGTKQQTLIAERTEEVPAFHMNQRDEAVDLHGKSGALMATRNTQMQTFVLEGNGSRPSHKGDGYRESDTMYTLNTTEQHCVACREGNMPVYHSSKNSFFTRFSDDKTMDTLVATDCKDPPMLGKPEPYYIVRRLTPTECARLQGFPDRWTDNLGTDNPTEEDIAFWTEVFETHRRAVTGAKKPKTRNQILKWLKDPQSDSAKYRLWGNGVCLPIVYFVLSGIVYYAQS